MKKVYLIAVVFALIAGFATYYFASEIQSKTTIKDAKMVTVYVPSEDIPANSKITADMLQGDAPKFVQKDVVAADATDDAVKTQEDLVDKVTVDPLYAGEVVNSKRLEDIDGTNVALSLKLPEGKVAYSFAAGSVTSVDGYIREGDTVDVIVYDSDKKESEVKYKDLKILRVSTSSANNSASANGSSITEYSTLTVEVSEDEALDLYNIENQHTYKLVLNHRN